MGVKYLPLNYQQWQQMRNSSIEENLLNGNFTKDLYKQYKKHLGWFRYLILKQAQILLVPDKVNELLGLGKNPLSIPMLNLYKLSRKIRLKSLLKNVILPSAYKKEILALDKIPLNPDKIKSPGPCRYKHEKAAILSASNY
jgi:hypothetical protein